MSSDNIEINQLQISSSDDEKNYTTDIIKVIIEDDSYVVYNLKNNAIIDKYKDVDSLIEKLLKNDFNNNVSRILKFQYLLNDINNRTLTMSHPYIFEDEKESIYGLENKVYMVCFSNTTGKKNAYAWWNIYGMTTDDSLDNIKVRIIFNKKDLLKNILLKKDKNFAYYFGDIQYIEDKKEKNGDIKDFFEKDKSFQFEDEFRVLIEYIGTDETYNDKYSDKYKIFFKLEIDIELYKGITSEDRLYFDEYKKLKNKYTNAVKHFLKEAQDKIQNKKLKNNYKKNIKIIKKRRDKYVFAKKNVYKNINDLYK